jgi:hypothetical protein
MIRLDLIAYFILVVSYAVFTGCASTGVDPTEGQEGFAGAPLEGNVAGDPTFGDNLNGEFSNENLESLNGELEGEFADENLGEFNNFNNFDNGGAVNSDTGNEFAGNGNFENFGFENQGMGGNEFALNDGGGNDFAFNQGAQADNPFAFNEGGGGGGNDFFANQNFQGNNQMFAQGNNQLFAQGDDAMFNNGGEGVNNAMAVEDEFAQAANTMMMDQGAVDTGINNVVDNAAAEPLEPVATSSVPVDPNGRVKYVMAGGSTMHDQPEGSIIKDLEQGDHPLVFNEGEWARTSDGFYVPSMTLSQDPIPRRKTKAIWTY